MPAASAVIKKVYPPTRQFLGRLNNPKVEYIKGISAAIAIEQKANTTNTRSTIVTSTEIYDYIKLLFAINRPNLFTGFRAGSKKNTVTDVVTEVKSFEIN